MITNLFSIFDPSTPNFISANWTAILLFSSVIPLYMWATPNRHSQTIKQLKFYIYSEFKPLIKKTPYLLVSAVSVFILIIVNNVAGLLPYIFTASRHLVFTLSLALPSWLAIILYGWLNNTSNLLAHLIPQGTPTILIPFIVLIETIRNLIRPGTLAIRLTANIIAGHLLITLLRSATPLTPLSALPLLLIRQTALTLLEIAVAFIQAYVFRVLITLYAAESAT
jgi:F-type H+-transporting ATPase subunit a